VKLSRDVASLLEDIREERLATSADYQESLAELEALALECAQPDWDGHGARPVSRAAIELATRVILALPADFHAPLVAAHPDGEVALTWRGERDTDFSVSIGSGGQLSYAGVFGPSVVSYGSENFSDDLPATILDQLRRLP
jgi:hypothetical protein